MKQIFKFKQFDVDQKDCAMKINTDGVLLGAMAAHQNPTTILDIGTGTGVIALMLAQRFSEAQVAAVEIDFDAAAMAKVNFANSVFSERMEAVNCAIENFESITKFDLIVTNPPFFVNDYKNMELKKEIARHASDTFFSQLVDKVDLLLSSVGSFWYVLPMKQSADVIAIAKDRALFVKTIIDLHSDSTKPAFRQIVELVRVDNSVSKKKFIIYESEKVYTSAYQKLLSDFFLAY